MFVSSDVQGDVRDTAEHDDPVPPRRGRVSGQIKMDTRSGQTLPASGIGLKAFGRTRHRLLFRENGSRYIVTISGVAPDRPGLDAGHGRDLDRFSLSSETIRVPFRWRCTADADQALNAGSNGTPAIRPAVALASGERRSDPMSPK